MNPAAAANDIVVSNDAAGALRRIFTHRHFANANAARAKISKQAMPDTAVLATLPEPDRVVSGVRDFTMLKSHVPRIVNLHRRPDGRRRLRWRTAILRQLVSGVMQAETVEMQIG